MKKSSLSPLLLLEVENLVCGYRPGFFLKDINFKVNEGELVGIIGPNGSGKSTLLKAISRILKPWDGRLLFQGKDIGLAGFKELAQRIAVLSQDSEALSLNLPVRDYVLLGRIPYRRRFQMLETKTDESVAEQMMALTDVLPLSPRNMNELSGGERQRAAIARALAQEPKLLLLDEPVTHLDIKHQVEILDLVQRLNKEKHLTVLMVLHDLNLASEYCGRLLLLKEGRIFKMGLPGEVLTYKIIEEVYKTLVVVSENPLSSRPHILLVPGEEWEKGGKRCQEETS
jgi:iron complex transport system ATP-binding protein